MSSAIVRLPLLANALVLHLHIAEYVTTQAIYFPARFAGNTDLGLSSYQNTHIAKDRSGADWLQEWLFGREGVKQCQRTEPGHFQEKLSVDL
jgi:hypothetical protein